MFRKQKLKIVITLHDNGDLYVWDCGLFLNFILKIQILSFSVNEIKKATNSTEWF